MGAGFIAEGEEERAVCEGWGCVLSLLSAIFGSFPSLLCSLLVWSEDFIPLGVRPAQPPWGALGWALRALTSVFSDAGKVFGSQIEFRACEAAAVPLQSPL